MHRQIAHHPTGRGRNPRRALAIALRLLPLLALLTVPGRAHAYTFPVDHLGGPRACASFVEDHGGWHAGIDLPRTNGATVVHAIADETLFHAYPLSFHPVQVQMGDNPSITGPWSFELSDAHQKYMLDILKVKRVTPGKPTIEYRVDHVVEVQPGVALDGVVLVPNFPSPADSLEAADQFEVDYAYYDSRIFQTTHRTTAGVYTDYAHIDNVHDHVAWNSYPATAANRYYGVDSGVPPGRAAHVMAEGEVFADIEQLLDFASEPHHLHLSISDRFAFPMGAMNPLTLAGFPTSDPADERPYVRGIRLTYGLNDFIFPDATLYGRVNVLVEARDPMGAFEADDDGDGAENNTREAGCYNAGYWVTADSAAGQDVAFPGAPNTMFAGTGKDYITGLDPLDVVLVPQPPFRVDINTNYHLQVSHVAEDPFRCWNTRARRDGEDNDGSDTFPARVNAETRFGDGRYTLHAKARDVVGWGAPRDTQVVVDNFRPFVRKVVVHDDSGELYSGEWNFDGTNIVFNHPDPDEGMQDALGRKRCADGLSDVVIDVTFSEGMREAFIGRLPTLGYTPRLHRASADEDSLWTATIPKEKLKTTREKAGRQVLEILGQDWAGNDIRQIYNTNPIDPADNSRDRAVMRGPDGTDTLHRFAICQSVCLVMDVTGSMYDEIEAMKQAMADVITYNENDSSRFVKYNVVTFQDDVQVRLSSKNPDAARAVIGSLFAGFGGACPEASVSALDSLPPLCPGGGQAILATDADPLEGRPRLEAAKARLRDKGIEVSVLLSGSCESFLAAPAELTADGPTAAALSRGNGAPGEAAARPGAGIYASVDAREAFREVTEATGGLLVQSLPTAQFAGAARAITARYTAGATLLARRLGGPTGGFTTLPVPVDSTSAELVVVLNGSFFSGSTLTLRRPSGAAVQLGDPDVTPNFAPGLEVLRIAHPAAGAWTADVTTVTGTELFDLTALARSPRDLVLQGAPVQRAGVATPLAVTVDGPGTPAAFRLIRADGAVEMPLTLFDDGLHADGAAADGTWGTILTLATPGDYRVAMDGTGPGGAFTRETARTLVVGLPALAGADTLDLGRVAVGNAAARPLYLLNDGNAPLTVGGVSTGASTLALGPVAPEIAPGGAARVDVRWAPTSPGPFLATLAVASDDPDHPAAARFVRGVALPPAQLTMTPDTLRVSLPQGDSTAVDLQLANAGGGPTRLSLSDTAPGPGPAAGGYRYRTTSRDGVPFRWVTLGSNAHVIQNLHANDAAGPFQLGFEFPFYGHRWGSFYISENGHVTLGNLPSLTASVFGPCPPASYFAPYISAYQEDLDLSDGGALLWQADAERLVVEFHDARRFDLGPQDTPLNAQIVLYADGAIELNYLTVPPAGYPLVGIGPGAAYQYLSPSCEIAEPARAGDTIRFWPDNAWLTLPDTADSLAAGEATTARPGISTRRVGFDVGGTYAAAITLLSEEPGAARREIPVRLTILPGPYTASGVVTALEDGAPVPGTVVTATGPYGSYAAIVDAAGHYDVAGLPAGHYALVARSPLFLASAPESLAVPGAAGPAFALTRPILALAPATLTATVAAGDSVCLPVVVRNGGTAALVLDGLRRAEPTLPASAGNATLDDPDYERVLEDPAGDTAGPDLLALDAVRTGAQLDFRLTLADSLYRKPPQVYISLDVDRNPATGANPPALGHGLATQGVGAEYELWIENACGGYGLVLDARDGTVLTGFGLQTDGAGTLFFSVPLADLGNDDGTANVAVTAFAGLCESGSTRPTGGPHPASAARAAGALHEAGPATDWMPEIGHGTVGACGWLSLVPRSATIAPGDSLVASVCVDARALADTTLECGVTFQSNDPRRPAALLPVTVTVSTPSGAPEPPNGMRPPLFALRQNEPNPVHGVTRIRFSLPQAGPVRLSLFDLSGRLVWRPLDETRPAGPQELRLDAAGRLAGGLYFYRLEAGGAVATRKMLVME